MSESNPLPKLSVRLEELLRHFHPAAAAEFTEEQLDIIAEEFMRDSTAQKWTEKQLDETKIRTMDFRNGVKMELQPAQELAAAWVAAARTMLMDAENYTETTYVTNPEHLSASYSMDVAIPQLPERYTLTVQWVAPGKLTPHEGRQKAEAERDALLELVQQWIAAQGAGQGAEVGDLISLLERGGFPQSKEA
jgi:hypothetical protein